ncbi:heterokaryon incompatibility protein-domain-containing protein [Cadophora sp. MPI-SDFR-AT-0126]|nr:heterokaryon incompatibility protein-domain-containing protein [Leotiomycetes sp. MPI-SDFR-AT-0126]
MGPFSVVRPRYQYSPLSQDEIRLIRLFPGPVAAEKIEVEMIHAIKAPDLVYEALSYAWGDPEQTDSVQVKEKTDHLAKEINRMSLKEQKGISDSFSVLPIAHNLTIALRHLRTAEETRVIWVDAICINQENDAEKSREVLQMGAVFSNAKNVVVWLGPSSQDSTLALKTLARLGEGVVYDPANHDIEYNTKAWAETLESDKQALRAEFPSWVAIGSLLRREWFERLWVFQEIALASSAIVVVGEYYIDWELFRLGVYWIWMMINRINSLPGAPNIENPRTNCLEGFLEISNRNLTMENFLLSALHLTRMASCSDKRDRLFGIRDILRVEDRQHIKPDYSLRTEDVYKATTISLINSQMRLGSLQWCVLQSPPSDMKLPSWIPDFSFQGLPEVIFNNEADGLADSSHSIENGDILTVHGVKVTEVIQVLATEFTRQSTDMELIEICRAWKQHLPFSAAYVTGSPMEDAFIEAIMGGRIQETLPEKSGRSPTTQTCKHVLLASEEFEEPGKSHRSDGSDRELVMAELRSMLRGRAFFNTDGGHIGMCPDSAQCGDILVTLLGCSVPLILRPRPDCLHEFHVVGECHVPGIMNAEAFLGQLPLGWTKRKIRRHNGVFILYEQGNIKTQKDPRINALPSGWRIMFGTQEHPLEVEPEPEDENQLTRKWFQNVQTGDRTYFNPALTPERLRERGVDIRDFKLV